MSASEVSPEHVRFDRAAVASTREAQWQSYVREAACGNSGALALLYDESSSIVYGIALRILRNDADAEEVVSDVYAQIWRSASSFDPSRGSVNAWLTTLARSRAIDRLRMRTRAGKEEGLGAAANVSSSEETPEQASWLGQQRRRVRDALEILSPAQREAIEMAYFSGLSQSELADHLHEPLGTIKTRIRLGMIKLREHLRYERTSIR